jgi:hypothetical protein
MPRPRKRTVLGSCVWTRASSLTQGRCWSLRKSLSGRFLGQRGGVRFMVVVADLSRIVFWHLSLGGRGGRGQCLAGRACQKQPATALALSGGKRLAMRRFALSSSTFEFCTMDENKPRQDAQDARRKARPSCQNVVWTLDSFNMRPRYSERPRRKVRNDEKQSAYCPFFSFALFLSVSMGSLLSPFALGNQCDCSIRLAGPLGQARKKQKKQVHGEHGAGMRLSSLRRC